MFLNVWWLTAEVLRAAVDQSDNSAVAVRRRRTEFGAVHEYLLLTVDTAHQDTALRVGVIYIPVLPNHAIAIHTVRAAAWGTGVNRGHYRWLEVNRGR